VIPLRARAGRVVAALVLAPLVPGLASDEPAVRHYRPTRQVPESLAPVYAQLAPGHDAFPEEKDAVELAARLDELKLFLRDGRWSEAVFSLAAPAFRGGRLEPATKEEYGSSALGIARSTRMSGELELERGAFADALASFVSELGSLQTAELLITAIDATGSEPRVAHTDVRYDLVGSGASGRAERVGRWRLEWLREAGGPWRIRSWLAQADQRSRAPGPVFTEVTGEALGAIDAFRLQLRRGVDAWISRLDAVFSPSGMGHHGVSAGDADGDGLDDLYVSQPAGLPNRLFRNRGDSSFEDVTARAGLLVLDSTSQSLFADVDNDGDQDLVLVTRSGPLLFLNDGALRFSPVAGAFRVRGALRGAPTSIAAADYDNDGFLDVYLCSYSYFIGASEDKAGTPTPYHDARNGPPNVLFRNDGHGRFVDVTAETGLDANNDRFSFAAAWGDYDEDGWPDLLVANDFGRKNLYHNEGLHDGKLRFRDVAAQAGVEDVGAGMSAAFVDFDGDGHLDIYTGNMWSAAGLRVTGLAGFKPDAPAEVRELYRRHARGNSLFRNRGDGTFEDVTLQARAELGRWAWSSDAVDFDSDGSPDLYVVNGMFTREPGEPDVDLDNFFWRQVVAASPLELRRGTPFDDAWRATNRLLAENGSQARHERNVLLRSDGHGGFDEVAGSAGLDLDQDGRSFAVLDYDADGDPDLAIMAARSSPQLRIFRNDFTGRSASLALRLRGTSSNRDAVGARVSVETDQLRRTKLVQAGSGFISQHSKELLFGLGKSERIKGVEVRWPDGRIQAFRDLPLNHRVWIEEGRDSVRLEPFRDARPATPVTTAAASAATAPAADSRVGGSWLYRPFPAPAFTARDLGGQERSLSAMAGHPALLFFWAASAPESLQALQELDRRRSDLTGAALLAVALDPKPNEALVRAAAEGLQLPVVWADDELAGTYSVLSRYLFDRREELRIPTALLLDSRSEIVKVYRDRISVDEIAADLPRTSVDAAARLARAVPFEGTFYTAPGERNYFQYSLDLAEQGYDAAAVSGFERAAELDPSAITLHNLGTLYTKAGRSSQARLAFERALKLDPGHFEASNNLGALLAQGGDVPGAIERFRAALKVKPDFPDALNNLGYALFQAGDARQAYDLYQKALAARPDFPEAFNNLGIFFGEQGDLERAEGQFRQAVKSRPAYGEAANNLALVLAARGDAAGAVEVLQRLLDVAPEFEMAYVTLSRIYLQAGRRREGIQVLELLLQRNPKNAIGLEMLRELRAKG
jgi:Tfp pilus assembly protein PilF/peroxiredoxin